MRCCCCFCWSPGDRREAKEALPAARWVVARHICVRPVSTLRPGGQSWRRYNEKKAIRWAKKSRPCVWCVHFSPEPK